MGPYISSSGSAVELMTQNATEKIVGEAVFTRKREKHDSPENDGFPS